LRKLLSTLLLAMLSFTVVSPLPSFGRLDDSSVPACCRKGGRHHCLVNWSERFGAHDHATQIGGPIEKCPYGPGTIPAVHPNVFGPPTSAAIFASLISHPAGLAQTNSKRRISGDRSRQKRGRLRFADQPSCRGSTDRLKTAHLWRPLAPKARPSCSSSPLVTFPSF